MSWERHSKYRGADVWIDRAGATIQWAYTWPIDGISVTPRGADASSLSGLRRAIRHDGEVA